MKSNGLPSRGPRKRKIRGEWEMIVGGNVVLKR